MRTPDIERISSEIRAVAAAEILPRWRKLTPSDIIEKTGPRDLVTVADKGAEVALGRFLEAHLPGSRLVGEEGVSGDATRLDWLGEAGTTWLLDPIDGTFAFTKGDDTFAVMLALVEDGAPVAAWIYLAARNDLYVGEKGGGVWRIAPDGSRTRMAGPAPLPVERMTGILSGNLEIRGRSVMRRERARLFAGIDRMICPGHDYPRVLRGEAQFTAYSRSMPWDHVPGLFLLAETGRAVARLDGTPYRPVHSTGGVLSAPDPDAWEAIVTRLTTQAGAE